MSSTTLPLDVIKTHILHPHIRWRNPETQSLLAARATCVAFWKALPLNEMLGIREETAKWLLMGKTAPWRNTDTMQARLTIQKKIRVSQLAGGTWLSDKSKRLNNFVTDGNGTRAYATVFTPQDKTLPLIDIVIIKDRHGVLRLQDTAFFITAILSQPGVLFIVSSLGIMYRFEPNAIYNCPFFRRADRQLNFMRHIPSRKHFDIPHTLPGLHNRFRLRDARTVDSKVFFFLTQHGFLLCGNMSKDDGHLAIIARNVAAFMLNEGSALCRMDNGALFVLNVEDPFNNDKPIRAKVADSVDSFLAVPELKTLWLASNDALQIKKAAVDISF